MFGMVNIAHAATTLVVDDDGMGTIASCNDSAPTYSTIQSAVNDAVTGDTVKVCPGTYNESVSVTVSGVTLSGAKAGVDARPNRGSGESIVQPPSGSIGVSLSGSGDVLDGFEVTAASNNPGVYTSPSADGYQVLNNILSNNTFGLYLNSASGTTTLVQHNRLVNNNLAGAAQGNGIYSDQGLQDASINQNKFANNTNAGVLIAYVASSTVDSVVIGGNGSTDDASFANIFSGTNLRITNNHTNDTDNGDDANQGSAIRLEGVDGVVVQKNKINNAAFSGIAVRDSGFGQPPTDNVTLKKNTVKFAENDGIDITTTTSGAVTAKKNKTFSNGNDGIELGGSTSDNLIQNNQAGNANGVWDCQDSSSGGHTAGTANFWLNDQGQADDPNGICHP
jgi:hypothetical protein